MITRRPKHHRRYVRKRVLNKIRKRCYGMGMTVDEATAMILLHPEVLDELVIWRMDDPRYVRDKDERKLKMAQRQFTIEIRVDYADDGKNMAMKDAMQEAARHVYATAALLADGVKPQIIVYSDDFFGKHEDIALLEDKIQQGRDLLGGDQEEPVSQELMDALTK